MKQTTLCYIEKDGKYLMLLRNKKQNDDNSGKWLGVGGKTEPYETAEECVIREAREETGYLIKPLLKGVVHFRSTAYQNEDMFLYKAKILSGELISCNEGELKWIEKEKITELNLWEGDKIFLPKLDEDGFFELLLQYDKDKLISHKFIK